MGLMVAPQGGVEADGTFTPPKKKIFTLSLLPPQKKNQIW